MTQIVFLGTGTPNPDPDRQGASLAIIAEGQPYIVDCGPGLVRQASAALKKGHTALAIEKLTRAFITHLHSDHTLGYPDLILTPAVTGRLERLQVWGPPGLKHMTACLLDAYSEDIEVRLNGGEPSAREAYEVLVHEVEEGEIYRDETVAIRAFAVSHGAWKHAFGFRFETADRVIVVSGDTTYNENLIRNAQGCDVLIHEVYSEDGFKLREPEWQRYHASYHTSGRELGHLASLVQPKLLLLYHQLPFGQPEEEILSEVSEHFSGDVISPNDLDAF